MLKVDVAGDRARATDVRGPELSVDLGSWVCEAGGPPITHPTERTVHGTTDRLGFPPVFVSTLDRGGEESVRQFGTVRFGLGTHTLVVEAPVTLYVRFEGGAVLTNPGIGPTELSFDERTTVSLGFAPDQTTPGTITVPRSPEGVATALSYAGANHRTLTAERSRPDMRSRAPKIEFGPEDVPRRLTQDLPTSDAVFVLPPDLSYLFPVSSLAYYLGATVSVGAGGPPRLTLPDRTIEFGRGTEFAGEVAPLLRRVFLLDTLVRSRGPRGAELTQASVLDDLGLDARALYRSDVATRVSRYCDVPFEEVEESLPEWHLSMYVEPEMANVPTLSHLLENIPNLFEPVAESLETEERLSRGLDDFYRSQQRRSIGVNQLKPVLGPGRSHGWLAEGIPIDVYKALPEAYDNRPDPEIERGRLSVVTVLNDIGMAAEYTDATQIYADHANLPLDVTVHKRLTVSELADVFEEDHDVVHYIGHCDDDGLRCLDGNLAASDLPETNVEAFILNACGSYHEGLELVRKGSVAGAVTFEKVLDSHAARVGTAFARLLIHGFSIDRSLDLARRRIIMGKDYAVVGDGTHALTRTGADVPLIARLEQVDGGDYRMEFEAGSPRVAGGWYRPPDGVEDGRNRLHGSSDEVVQPANEMANTLRHADVPVIYDGDIHWSDEVAARIEQAGTDGGT